jgi:hypothetical protein
MERHYSISFTTSSLRKTVSLKLAKLFLEYSDWNRVREIAFAENTLQQRTDRSRKKLFQELSSRLKCLDLAEIQLLVSANEEEQKQLLWLALARRYDFIYDFALEVLREKLISLQYKLIYEDFDAFWGSKAVIYDALDKVTTATQKKARQIVFQMMREADIIDQDNTIQLAQYHNAAIELLKENSPQDLALFTLAQILIP